MRDPNGSQENQKATKIRRKPEGESVLRPMFAATRHSSGGALDNRGPTARDILQRRCACGAQAIGGGQCGACLQKRESDFLQRTSARDGSSAGDAENQTGLPHNLEAGLEHLSGFDLSAVRVHHNAPQPAQFNALAYTQGTNIYVGPGQAKHLPHEGWHVVQQMQGRVRPTAILTKGAWVNDDQGLEREADAMGARANHLAAARPTDFHTAMASEDGEVLDDQPFKVGLKPTLSAAVIQRVANFKPGPVSAATNMADHIIAGNSDAGFTPPTLNGAQVLNADAASAAIRPPTLGGASRQDGTTEAWVNAVATNEASFTMRVPSAGPWSTTTAKANVAALFARFHLTAQAGCGTAGDTTFKVNGKPSDAQFAADVRTHENLHAADHEAGFKTVMVPWDQKLEAARAAGTKFSGPDSTAAEAALYRAMGGTPDEIATQQVREWIRLNFATHAGGTIATGGSARISNSAADATCTTSSVDVG